MIEEKRLYDDWLLRAAVAALEDGAASLRTIVELCEGADPLAVKRVLASTPHADRLGVALQQLDRPRDADGPVEPGLPPPHPLDYEWRFSRNGASTILDHVSKLSGRDLLFMGATTVAIVAGRRGWRGRLVALDQSETVVESARLLGLPIDFVISDVSRRDAQQSDADVVVIDPPWYLEHAQAFFSAAAKACRLGGFVLASLPGEGTRPGVSRERKDLIAWCKRWGLEVVAIHSQCVAYETPLFEHNAFRAAGLGGDVRTWRRGDLWVLKRTGDFAEDNHPCLESAQRWHEHGMDRMRVRFRSLTTRSGETRLESLVEGDILPTVSRRDPRRDLARVWTSGNRVFGCDDPDTLLVAARARAKGLDETDAAAIALGRSLSDIEQRTLRESCDRLNELSYREKDEQAEVTKEHGWSESVTA